MAQSQEFIQRLLQAEKEAENVIANAKKARLAKLKQAKEKAEDDIKAFRDEQERKFQSEMGGKAAADPSAELKGATEKEADQVMQDYQQHKDRTIAYVISKVLDVPTQLSTTQKQALTTGVV
mmetsp:Transcript_25724/g.73997  ORF Transcript_25724/g.73997 Transcript_25724/m.73997 type:complete len:122 (-) Transcript_25724:62-427(-)